MVEKNQEVSEAVEAIKLDVDAWISFVNGFGNQCAYTDRIIEAIIQDAEELKKIYKSQFEEGSEG